MSLASQYLSEKPEVLENYSLEELVHLTRCLQAALANGGLALKKWEVDTAKDLLKKTDWSDLPAEFEGNKKLAILKVAINKKLRLERRKSLEAFFRTRPHLLLSPDLAVRYSPTSEQSTLAYIKSYRKTVFKRVLAGQGMNSLSSLRDLAGTEANFTYILVNTENMLLDLVINLVISITNQSEDRLSYRFLNSTEFIISDDPDLVEYESEDLLDLAEYLRSDESLEGASTLYINLETVEDFLSTLERS